MLMRDLGAPAVKSPQESPVCAVHPAVGVEVRLTVGGRGLSLAQQERAEVHDVHQIVVVQVALHERELGAVARAHHADGAVDCGDGEPEVLGA